MAEIGGDVPILLRDFARECFAHDHTATEMAPETIRTLQAFENHRLTVVDLACKEETAGFFSGDHHERQNVEVKFGDFVYYFDASFRGEGHWLGAVEGLQFYLCQCPIAVLKPDETCTGPALPDMMQLFRIPPALATMNVGQVNLWMAVKTSRTSIHYDAYRNVLVVLAGKKTVKLYPPSDTKNLYPRPIYSRSSNHSSVNFVDPDLSVHPKFAQTTPVVLAAEIGDAIYIPEGWWHQVDSTPFTIAINFWFDGLRDQLVRNPQMGVYYARVIMEDHIRAETTRAIQQLRTKSSSEDSPVISASRIATSFSKDGRESMLLSIVDEADLKNVQVDLAMQHPAVWKGILTGASDGFAAFLTDLWDRSDNESDWIASLFKALGEGDQIKHDLLTKHDRFKQQICTQVLAATFGI